MMTDLIFDFFGTLVNYTPDVAGKEFVQSHEYLLSQGFPIGYQAFLDGWSEAFSQLEQQAQRDYREYHMRDGARRFFTNVFDIAVSPTVCDTFVALFINEWNRGVTYHPNIKGFLIELAEIYRLSIITNTHYPALIDDHLAAMEISHLFSLVTKSVDHGLRKPHPQIFNDTLARLSIAAGLAIYIGDNFEADYQGANGVGLRCLLIDSERRHLNLGADRIDHLYDLKQWLADRAIS